MRRNRYISIHTYPGPGVYRIFFIDPNRNEGIINIPNSVSLPLCMEAYLTVFNPDSYCVNNSVVFDSIPFFYAQTGKPFNYNLTVTDPDHDSLSYELIVPVTYPGVPVPEYWLPASSNNFLLSSLSGQITWDSPVAPGEYNIAIKVSEWRHHTIIGYVMREFQVSVQNGLTPDTLNTFNPLTLSTDASGNYFVAVNPGDTVQLQAIYNRSAVYSPPVIIYGEAFQMPDPPSVQYSTGAGTAIANFIWVPGSSKMRWHPYVFVISGKSSYKEQSDISFAVYVNGPPADTCPEFVLPPEWIPLPFQNYEMHLYPNPSNESITISINRSLMEISKKIKFYDAVGRIARIIDVNFPIITIQKGSLRKGVYFVAVTNQSEEVILYKEIIIY